MVEIHDIKRLKCIGNFRDFKCAKPTLDAMRLRGELPETVPAVQVVAYKNRCPKRVYVAYYQGKWRTTNISNVRTAQI